MISTRTIQSEHNSDHDRYYSLQVVLPDVRASNGIIQGINRVMFPPPQFTKAMYGNVTVEITNSTAIAAVATTKPVPKAAAVTPVATPVAKPVAAAAPAPVSTPASMGTSDGSDSATDNQSAPPTQVIKAQG